MAYSMYADEIQKLQAVAGYLGLTREEIDYLSIPEKVIEGKITIKTQNGLKTFHAFRSQHNSALGPYKGGIRFAYSVNYDEVVALSMAMTWKNSLLKLPYGGGKGGVNVDPKSISQEEIEAVARKYVDLFFDEIGEDLDVPAPDVNTNAQIMAWMIDEYQKLIRKRNFATFTGKPEILGGISIREYSTGLGVAAITEEAALNEFKDIKGKRVAIQGFGNVGTYAAKFLEERGFKIIAVSDSKGGIIDNSGINVEKLIEIKRTKGSVSEYPATKINNDDIIKVDCDILIPAAVEGVITKENASKVKAKIIVEAANGPVTHEADEILSDRIIVPDILANSGGVVGSYMEWANNRAGNIFDENWLKERIISKMQDAYKEVLQTANKYNTTLRNSAMILAVYRVINAARTRGWI